MTDIPGRPLPTKGDISEKNPRSRESYGLSSGPPTLVEDLGALLPQMLEASVSYPPLCVTSGAPRPEPRLSVIPR
jgi:hypothetical protein